MKLCIPNYYKKFHCIADKCNHSCCSAGWEIDIDEETLNYYNSVSGKLGDKLKQNIVNNSDNTSKCFNLCENNNCPFLNSNKLCEIYINLGEEHLCNICTEHPRFYEWFDNYKELGIGLCCEEAARIILSESENFTTCEIEVPFEECDEYSTEIYNYLYFSRQKIINYLNNSSNINEAIRNVVWYCNVIGQNIDSNLLDDEDIFSVNTYEKTDISEIIEFLLTLETNNKEWIPYLQKCIKVYNSSKDLLAKFETQHSELEKYLKNISIYFVWRYFLKGVFDEEIISKITLMAISVSVIKTLFFVNWIETNSLSLEDCVEIVRKYSEEIEYNEKNLNKLADACYEQEIFNIENIIGLF